MPSPIVSTVHILLYNFTELFDVGESSGKVMKIPESFDTSLLIKFPSQD